MQLQKDDIFLLLRLGNKKGMHIFIFVSTHSPEDVFLLSLQPFTCTGIHFEYFKKLKSWPNDFDILLKKSASCLSWHDFIITSVEYC